MECRTPLRVSAHRTVTMHLTADAVAAGELQATSFKSAFAVPTDCCPVPLVRKFVHLRVHPPSVVVGESIHSATLVAKGAGDGVGVQLDAYAEQAHAYGEQVYRVSENLGGVVPR